jgi:hypothetical protein
MYEWKPDALKRPWTMQCPHCKELFPKNDFAKFYRSGLNKQNVFDPQRADRSLLFNAEHPDPSDPLQRRDHPLAAVGRLCGPGCRSRQPSL